MISGLELLEQFNTRYDPKTKVSYTLNSGSSTKGPLRSMQKFMVILLTSKGSDPIRPWFGTKISLLNTVNATNKTELTLFVRSECQDAITQFFALQEKEAKQNAQTGYDVIQGLELTSLRVNDDHTISLTFKFTPLKSDAITLAIKV